MSEDLTFSQNSHSDNNPKRHLEEHGQGDYESLSFHQHKK